MNEPTTAGKIKNDVHINFVSKVSKIWKTNAMAIEIPSIISNDANRVMLGTKLHFNL